MAWWFLVSVFAGHDSIPRAIGPYPSKELCQIAAGNLMPTERRFWSKEKREKAEAEDAIRAEERRKEIDAIRPRTEGWHQLKDGSMIEINKAGVVTAQTSTGTYMTSGPIYSALTDCVEIPDGKQ